jgi:putative spermidine/putrescine transport system substrate-binding protein
MPTIPRVSVAMLLVVVALSVAACGDSSDNGGSGSSSAASDGDTESFDDQTLSYIGFGGRLDEEIKNAWMDPFAEKTGAEFVLDSPTDYSKIETQVMSGNVSYDIIDGDQFFINPQCGKLFEEIDVPQTDVLPDLRVTSKCGVADYVYGIGMFYDKSKFPNGGPQTCADFFDTTKFPGKRLIWTYVAAAGSLECAAIAAGADPKNPYPIDLDAAFAKLETLKGNLGTFDSSSQAADAMVNGDAPIIMATTRPYAEGASNGANYGVAEEFVGRSAGAFAIPKGAPHKDAAIAWLKYIMDPEVNRTLPPKIPPYTSATGGPVPSNWSPEAQQVDLTSGPLAKNAFTVDQKWWEDNYDAVSERYTALLAD